MVLNGHVEPEVGLLPGLLLAAHVGPERLRLLGRVAHPPVGAEGLEDPRVRLRRGHPLHLEGHRDGLPGEVHRRVEHRVVPGVARHRGAAGRRGASGRPSAGCAWTLEGLQPSRRGRWATWRPRSFMTPASPQWRLWRFQLMGFAGSRSLECRNAAADLDEPAERARRREGVRALRPRQEGELRGHAHEAPEARGLVPDAPGRGEVDAEGLLREEVLARAQDVQVDGLVAGRGAPRRRRRRCRVARAARGGRRRSASRSAPGGTSRARRDSRRRPPSAPGAPGSRGARTSARRRSRPRGP